MKRLAVAMLVISACGTTPPVTTDGGADGGEEQHLTEDGGTDAGMPDAGPYVADPLIVARPFATVVPVGYARGTPTPLVVLLHGYTATAATQDAYFKLSALAQQRTFLLALPDGTVDGRGQNFWNATDACCAFGATVDDVAYVTAVIHDMQARFSVDPKRIFLVGHSNGAFMSHRMACDRSELVAGIVALAGNVWADTAKCNPTGPVNVLQVHGTLDAVIRYGGGTALVGQPPYPAAETSVGTWAAKNRCTGTQLEPIGGELDLVTDLAFSETQRESFTGCPPGAAAELWRIRGGSHLPLFNDGWASTIYTWLSAHPKP